MKWFDHRTPNAVCPNCRKLLDVTSTTYDSRPPVPGDWSVCTGCGATLRFTRSLALRRADPVLEQGLTPEQRRELLRMQRIIWASRN